MGGGLVFPSLVGHYHIIFFSSAAENILMIMAMGYKVQGTHREKEQIQKEKEHSYNELAKLIYPHQLEQLKFGNPSIGKDAIRTYTEDAGGVLNRYILSMCAQYAIFA